MTGIRKLTFLTLVLMTLSGCAAMDQIFQDPSLAEGKWIDGGGITRSVLPADPLDGPQDIGSSLKANGNAQAGYAGVVNRIISYKKGGGEVGAKYVRGSLSADQDRLIWRSGELWHRYPSVLTGIEENISYSGNSYSSTPIATDIVEKPRACRQICEADSNCGAFTYSYSANVCELQRADDRATARERTDSNGFFSGIFLERLSLIDTSVDYVIRSTINGFALDTIIPSIQGEDMKVVHHAKMTGTAHQTWTFEHVDRDIYTIRNKGSRQYMWVDPATKDSQVYLEDVPKSDAQRFEIEVITDVDGYQQVFIIPKSPPPMVTAARSYLVMHGGRAFVIGEPAYVRFGSLSSTNGEWELLPSPSLALFEEPDITIDVINQGLFYASYYVFYNGKMQDKFIDVPEMNVTGFLVDQIPSFDNLLSNVIPTSAKDVFAPLKAIDMVGGVLGLGEEAAIVIDFLVPDEVDEAINTVGTGLIDISDSIWDELGLESVNDIKKELEVNPRSFSVPARAQDVYVQVRYAVPGMAARKTIGMVNFDDLGRGTLCVNASGTPIEPSVSTDCSRWDENTIKTLNDTGETIYVMWTDEINWSVSNVTRGVVTGLLLSNAQNLNSSFFRYFAIANAHEIEVADPAYEFFKYAAICSTPQETTLVLTQSIFDMATNAVDIASAVRARPKSGQRNKGDDAAEALTGFFGEWASDVNEQSDETKSTYRPNNPIMFGADMLGGETKTIMAVNESLTKFWIIDSAIDDNWIIQNDAIVEAKVDNGILTASGGRSAASMSLSLDGGARPSSESCSATTALSALVGKAVK